MNLKEAAWVINAGSDTEPANCLMDEDCNVRAVRDIHPGPYGLINGAVLDSVRFAR